MPDPDPARQHPMSEPEITRDKRRVLEYLRGARKFMPYLHESRGAHEVVKLLGSRDRAQRALVALVQDRKITYLENCSPDHYQAHADMSENWGLCNHAGLGMVEPHKEAHPEERHMHTHHFPPVASRIEWAVIWVNGRPGWPNEPIQIADDEAHARRLVKDFPGEVALMTRKITVGYWLAATPETIP